MKRCSTKSLVLGRRAKSSFAAATLTLIGRNRRALDVAAVGNRDRNVFVGNQVLDRELDAFVDDLGAARIAKLFLDFFEFIADHAAQRTLIGQNLFQFGDELDDRLRTRR